MKELFFSAFTAYFVMILCGTLGAPADIADVVTWCPHANINVCLQQGIQICETVSGQQDPDDNMSLELYLNSTTKVKFNTTVRIADFNEAPMDCKTRYLDLN